MIGTVGPNGTYAAAFKNAENCERNDALSRRHHVVSGALRKFNLQRWAHVWLKFVQIVDRKQSADRFEIFGDCFSQCTALETIQSSVYELRADTRELGLAKNSS